VPVLEVPPMSESEEGVLEIVVRDNVVMVRGDLDMDTVGEFASVLATMDETVVLDLAGVSFLDSTGLQCLVQVREAAQERGRDVIVRSPSTAIQRVLDLTNMWERLAIER
jgi:anti-anti-sigma factor